MKARFIGSFFLPMVLLVVFSLGADAAISGHYKGQGTGSLASGWKGSCYFDIEVRLSPSTFEVIDGKNICGDKTKKWLTSLFTISGQDLVNSKGEPVGMIMSDSVTAQLSETDSQYIMMIHLKQMPIDNKVTLQFDDTDSQEKNSYFGILDRF